MIQSNNNYTRGHIEYRLKWVIGLSIFLYTYSSITFVGIKRVETRTYYFLCFKYIKKTIWKKN